MYEKAIRFYNGLGDGIIINCAYYFAFGITFGQFDALLSPEYLILWAVINFVWLFSSRILKPYRIYRVTDYPVVLQKVITSVFLQFILVEALIGISGAHYVSQQLIAWLYTAIFLAMPIWRYMGISYLRELRKRGENNRKVVIAGKGPRALELRHIFQQYPEFGYECDGFFDNDSSKKEVLGSVASIMEYASKNRVDEIYCSLAVLNEEEVQELTEFASDECLRIKFLPESDVFDYNRYKLDYYAYLPVLVHLSSPLDEMANQWAKRAFDILFASAVSILILSWVLPILMLLIRLESKGSVIFSQKRTGLDKKEFTCFKLRTMYQKDSGRFEQARKDDPRITRIGRILRKTNLDELPQFFNVILGDMSIIGPRPHPTQMTEQYAGKVEKYMARHLVKPGITGLSQVKGYRGETRDIRQMRNRVKMDVFYLQKWSFFFDVKISFLTVLNMIRGEKNAY